jgi:hypothetical protein
MRALVRWTLLIFFTFSAVYCWMAVVQSASFSAGPASPTMVAIYKERVLLIGPSVLSLFAIGILFFIVLKPKG